MAHALSPWKQKADNNSELSWLGDPSNFMWILPSNFRKLSPSASCILVGVILVGVSISTSVIISKYGITVLPTRHFPMKFCKTKNRSIVQADVESNQFLLFNFELGQSKDIIELGKKGTCLKLCNLGFRKKNQSCSIQERIQPYLKSMNFGDFHFHYGLKNYSLRIGCSNFLQTCFSVSVHNFSPSVVHIEISKTTYTPYNSVKKKRLIFCTEVVFVNRANGGQ